MYSEYVIHIFKMTRSKKEGPTQGPIINEVLCWAQNMINVSNELNFINLGSVGFEEREISRSRDLLISLLPKKDAPLLKKRVPRRASDPKSVQDLKEIYNIFQEYGKSEIIPNFAAVQLDKMPPISYESPDATAMLIAFKKLETKVGQLQDSLDNSKGSTEGILDHITNMENRLSNVENPNFLNLRSRTNPRNEMPLSCTDCGCKSLNPINNISDKEEVKINVASYTDANTEVMLPTEVLNNEDSEKLQPVLESPKPRSCTSIDANTECTGLSENKKGKEIVIMNTNTNVALNENPKLYGNSEVTFSVLQIMSILLAMAIVPLTFSGMPQS